MFRKSVVIVLVIFTSCWGSDLVENNIQNVTVPSNINRDSTLMTPIPLRSPPTENTESEIVLTTSVDEADVTKSSTTTTTVNDDSLSNNDYDGDGQQQQISMMPSTTETTPESMIPVTTKRHSTGVRIYDYHGDSNDWNDSENTVEIEIPKKLRDKLMNETDIFNEYTPSLKQVPTNPLTMVVTRSPCECDDGLCACCTGMIMQAFNSQACMNLKYIPEDLAFDMRMMFNNIEVYRRRISGRNPPPVCINPARIPFIDVCATFYDIYFVGRNLHICLDVGASFQEFEFFNRQFDCMRLGAQGVKVVKPEEGAGLSYRPGAGVDADIDEGDDDDEYDEIVRKLRSLRLL